MKQVLAIFWEALKTTSAIFIVLMFVFALASIATDGFRFLFG